VGIGGISPRKRSRGLQMAGLPKLDGVQMMSQPPVLRDRARKLDISLSLGFAVVLVSMFSFQLFFWNENTYFVPLRIRNMQLIIFLNRRSQLRDCCESS